MDTEPGRDTVVIAASAGGIEALQTLLSALPADLRAAVLVVLHIPASGGRALPRILDRAGWLPAATAVDGEPLRHGRVYVAAPDHHLLVRDGGVHVSHGPRRHGHRPAADPLFQSAASARGPRVIGVVLSGMLDDGAAGCAAIERAGGLVAVQDPADSAYDAMPRAALAATRHAVSLTAEELGFFIAEQSRTPVRERRPGQVPPGPAADRPERGAAARSEAGTVATEPAGSWSGMTCPECGGPLNVRTEPGPAQFTCRLGHGWSAASLLDGQSEAVERALWIAALRLEERVRLCERMAVAADERGHKQSAELFRTQSRESDEALRTIRALVEGVTRVETGGVDLENGNGTDTGGHGATPHGTGTDLPR